MKFAVFTSVLAVFSGLSSSAAVPIAEGSRLEARATATYYPSLVVEISSPDSGYVSTNEVWISRYTSTQGQQYDTNGLLAYGIDQGHPGKTCSFIFTDGWYAGGTRKVQLFTVGDSSTVIEADDTFTHRPYRNNALGIFTISQDSSTATWDDIPTPTFPCPASATTLNYEVVPEGDSDWAGWPIDGGLAVVVLP